MLGGIGFRLDQTNDQLTGYFVFISTQGDYTLYSYDGNELQNISLVVLVQLLRQVSTSPT